MQLPSEAPVMTLANAILFPQSMLPLFIFEPRYRRMLAEALGNHRMFCVAMQRPDQSRERPCPVAGLGLIRAAVKNRDGTSHLVVQGLARVKLGKAVRYRPYRVHRIAALPTGLGEGVRVQALAARVVELVTQRLDAGASLPFQTLPTLEAKGADGATNTAALEVYREVVKHLASLDDPEQLADLISATLLPAPAQRQSMLEMADVESRLRYLIRFLLGDTSRPDPATRPEA